MGMSPPMTVNDLLLSSDPPPAVITSFRGAYEFLSNFYYCPVRINCITYPSAEHAYQCAKAKTRVDFERVMACVRPGEAKAIGRTVQKREDWEEVKVEKMLEILQAKFSNPFLRDLLLLTGDAELVEGNHWGDVFWGRCEKTGQGQNVLGTLLMIVREDVR
jgi:ribA/ribD-fused uncharacterized protein